MRIALILALAPSLFAAGELSNRRAPGFSLPDPSAKLHEPVDYRGKVLIIDFMQVSCPHCAKFSGILEQVKAKYGDKVAVLSIVNPPSQPQQVMKYIADHKLKSPILYDCGQAAWSYLMPKSGTTSIPHVFLIDAEGMIRNDIGYSEAAKNIFEGNGIYAEIDKLLAPPKKK